VEKEWKDKIKDSINNHIKENCNETVPLTTVSTVFVTFNSTCNYDDDEASRLSPQASLGIRLVASRNGWSHTQTSDLLGDSSVVSTCAKLKLKPFLKNIAPENEGEALIILIDEILKLRNDEAIHDILLQLSNFQQDCLKSQKKVFVLMTSLSSGPPASLTLIRSITACYGASSFRECATMTF
jgi:hypothetical protein